jgi:predicted GIY-YIG superfamily endonuclease
MNKFWFVYIVRCNDDSLYTGVTTDVVRRVDQHNSGRGAKYTRSRRPVRGVWEAMADSRSTAQKIESSIKKLSKEEKEKLVVNGVGCMGLL